MSHFQAYVELIINTIFTDVEESGMPVPLQFLGGLAVVENALKHTSLGPIV